MKKVNPSYSWPTNQNIMRVVNLHELQEWFALFTEDGNFYRVDDTCYYRNDCTGEVIRATVDLTRERGLQK